MSDLNLCSIAVRIATPISLHEVTTLSSFHMVHAFRERKISPKFFRPKFFRGRCQMLIFPGFGGLTEVFGRMSAGISGQKLPLWAEFSFLSFLKILGKPKVESPRSLSEGGSQRLRGVCQRARLVGLEPLHFWGGGAYERPQSTLHVLHYVINPMQLCNATVLQSYFYLIRKQVCNVTVSRWL